MIVVHSTRISREMYHDHRQRRDTPAGDRTMVRAATSGGPDGPSSRRSRLRTIKISCWGDLSVPFTDKSPQQGIMALSLTGEAWHTLTVMPCRGRCTTIMKPTVYTA
jgi:hypothetical protein